MKTRYCCLFSTPIKDKKRTRFFVNGTIVSVYGNYKTLYGAVKSIETLENPGQAIKSEVPFEWTIDFDHIVVDRVIAESSHRALIIARRNLNTLLDREKAALCTAR